jgi:hypothetical protein
MVTRAPFASPFNAGTSKLSIASQPTAAIRPSFAPQPGVLDPAAAQRSISASAAPPTDAGRQAFPSAGALPTPLNIGASGAAGPRATNPSLQPGAPLQDPGNNFVNQGLGEQAIQATQNRLLEDPASAFLQNSAKSTGTASQGENFLNQNLTTLNGPGQGEQYWNQQQGALNSPFAGEQFAREATQAMAPTGAAGAFNTQAQAKQDQFTNFQGAGNTQGQFNQSSQSLANGTQGEQGLGQIAGQYDQKGTYNGQNNAQGQFNQNASSGPLAAQQFYDQVQGQAGTTGKYSDPNLSSQQYQQTQGAFGDLPIANFDPFYDRASQLGVQNYNKQAAGRGVYGSSEALSGVGNVITDIEAQRANRSFDAEMQRSVEQRNRQALLGQQAQAGDQSSIAAFGANLQGLNTFGNLANQAGQQTLGQQTMLGNQARSADVSATDAFNQNLQGAQTFANINNQQGQLELDRNQVMGNMANQSDTQALGAQNSNVSGLNALGNIAGQADTAETNRFQARTNAMNNADQTQLNRFQTGADTAFRTDDSNRADFTAQTNAANQAAGLQNDRTRLGADIENQASQNDLNRLNAFNNQAQGAEQQRQNRNQSTVDATMRQTDQVQRTLSDAQAAASSGEYQSFEDYMATTGDAALQEAGYDDKRKEALRQDLKAAFDAAQKTARGAR